MIREDELEDHTISGVHRFIGDYRIMIRGLEGQRIMRNHGES
jgi:hypothetical protein